jgi:hypothetical protein
LKKNGTILFSVPDVSESLEKGDISFCMHEHLNYFTKETLKNILEITGFININVSKTKYGGGLIASAVKKNIKKDFENKEYENVFNKLKYMELLNIKLLKLNKIMKDSNNTEIGIYVPLRAFPYIRMLDLNVDDYTYFDDKESIKGKYYDGCSKPIMSFNEIKNFNLNVIIIFSLTFSELIKKRILKLGLPIKIYTIGEL